MKIVFPSKIEAIFDDFSLYKALQMSLVTTSNSRSWHLIGVVNCLEMNILVLFPSKPVVKVF